MQNTPPSSNAYRAITHPSGYEVKRPHAPKNGDPEAKLYGQHDSAILKGQDTLVAKAKKGQLSKEQFVELAQAVESFEAMRADLRGGGLTREETARLRSELRDLRREIRSGQSPAAPAQSEALSHLYEDLRAGDVDVQQAVAELNWRGQKAYGQVVAQREGPVAFDERAKQRAALAQDIDPQKVSARVKATSDGKYHPGTIELVRKALDLFPKLDANGDGVVNRAEARTLLTQFEQLGLTAAEAATLYSQQHDLVDALDPGWESHEKLTTGDLKALLPENQGQAPARHVDEILTQVSIRLRNQEKLGVVPEVSLYLSCDGPDPLKVNQGTEGSCWFLGGLPTLTPDELTGLLVAKDDGNFEMTLPDGTVESITPLNEAERRVYSRGDGSWSGLLEKGVSQLLARTGDDITGGFAKDGLKLLRGVEADGVSIMDAPLNAGEPDLRDRRELAKMLERSTKAGLAIFTHAFIEDHDADVSAITGLNHAYTVVGYDPKTEMLKIRNPWGNGEKADKDGVNDGNFTMPLLEFSANYSYMYVQRPT
jgi:hypothetical protein